MQARLRGYAAKASPVLRVAADMLFPPRCPACACFVAQQGAFCAECWGRMHFIAGSMCRCCGLPFDISIEEAICGRCAAEKPVFIRAVSVLRYDEGSRAAVVMFKFHDRTQLAPLFGRWMARAGAELLAKADAVLPVPLHYRRLLARRYNQAGLLAQELAAQGGVKLLPDALSRVKPTGSQTGLSRAARERNLRGAFAVKRREAVKGSTLLLVDDVMTTGATLNACARALRDAGARDVYALTLARTVLAE